MIKSARMTHPGRCFLLTAACALIAWGGVFSFDAAHGQEAGAAEDRVALTAEELEELAGPIALYPDDLVSIVLPAATYPLQVVQAARFLEALEDDPELEPDEAWDDSIIALLNYPEALELMNEDLDWTWALGEAALYQQAELLNAIQAFRDRAYAAGNLQTDERQVVTRDDEAITIKPADPEVIYVPYYEPRHVVVHQPYPVYHYHPHAYPVYYYPYSYGHSFGSGFFWGVTTAFSIGWHSHYLHVHHNRHYAHPYYGHYYHYPWYRRHSVSTYYGRNIWRPSHYSGARQVHTVSVGRANRSLGATTTSRGRMRNQPAANPPLGTRLRNQPTLDTRGTADNRPTASGRRGASRTPGATRAGTVTEDALNRARNASRPRNQTDTISRTRTGTFAPTAAARENFGQRRGGDQRPGVERGATRALPGGDAPSGDTFGVTRSRNQPRAIGSNAPRTFGGVAPRPRTQTSAPRGISPPRGGAVTRPEIQRGAIGGARAPVSRGIPSPQASNPAISGSAGRDSANPRAGGVGGRTRYQR